MQNEYTAVVKQEGDYWVGWIEEVPGVNCQERTYSRPKWVVNEIKGLSPPTPLGKGEATTSLFMIHLGLLYEELRETLAVTLREALEFNRQDALSAAGSGYKEEKIAI